MIEGERFKELAAHAWDTVPAEWKQQIDNVALLIEDEPNEQIRNEERLGPHDTLLGLYQGISNAKRGAYYGIGDTLPDTITLYRLPMLEEARAQMREEPNAHHTEERFEAIVRDVIRETLWHEIGHYFGLSEEEIDRREEEGTNRFES